MSTPNPMMHDQDGGSGPNWIRSSLSGARHNCAEVAALPDGNVAMRNSRHPAGPVLEFTPDEWRAFIGGAKLGEFDAFGGGA